MEYFPTLTAAQVKQVIEDAAQQPNDLVKNPGNGEEVALSQLSRTGGIINAYESVKRADTIKGARKITPTKTKGF
jgi:hypothetical protein